MNRRFEPVLAEHNPTLTTEQRPSGTRRRVKSRDVVYAVVV
jgi:hypothetical protein